MTEIKRVIAETTRNDGATLHIIERMIASEHAPKYVVCWNLILYEFNHAEWDWGTYCNIIDTAFEAFTKKALEHGFNSDECFS